MEKRPTPFEKPSALSQRPQHNTSSIALVAIDKATLNLILNALCVALFAGLTALGLHVLAAVQGGMTP